MSSRRQGLLPLAPPPDLSSPLVLFVVCFFLIRFLFSRPPPLVNRGICLFWRNPCIDFLFIRVRDLSFTNPPPSVFVMRESSVFMPLFFRSLLPTFVFSPPFFYPSKETPFPCLSPYVFPAWASFYAFFIRSLSHGGTTIKHFFSVFLWIFFLSLCFRLFLHFLFFDNVFTFSPLFPTVDFTLVPFS